jgi:hypothetical protein
VSPLDLRRPGTRSADESGVVRVQRIPDPRSRRVVAKGSGKSGGTSGGITTPHQPVEYPRRRHRR